MRTALRRLVRLGAAVACCGIAATFAAPAATAQDHLAKYCYTEVARIHPHSPETRVVSQTCSNGHLPNSVLPDNIKQPSTKTLLVTFFEDEDYLGAWDTVGGDSGTCDSSGYGLSDLTLANFNVNGISSYRLNGKCTIASYWNQTNYQGQGRINYRGDNFFVGAPWNDDLYSMKVWNG